MNWEALAATAELLGALGVLASLIYLAVQIRQNTAWLRQQAFQLSTNETWIDQGSFRGWWEVNAFMFSPGFKTFVQELLDRHIGDT